MIELSSIAQALGAVAHARVISAEAYTLHGRMLHALEDASRRGAQVTVSLEGSPDSDSGGRLAKENARVAGELRSAGACVRLEHPLHAKAIDADGTLYLDEKNWAAGDLVLRDRDRSDRASIPAGKRDALRLEGRLLREDGISGDAIVESESFGSYNAVHGALAALATTGHSPRLLVCRRELAGNARERNVLDELSAEGVRVRVCSDTEKLAAAGNRAWLGSANATTDFGPTEMTDWGTCTGDRAIYNAVRQRLEAQWATATPWSRSADCEQPACV